jgi:hypothetical protein
MTKRLTNAQRADLLHYAKRLVTGGVSRRRMNTILKDYSLEKYGIATSVGADTHSSLFKGRLEQLRRHEDERVKGFKRPRKRRESNYNKLIGGHFLPEEAKIMIASLNTLRYPEVQKMMAQRERLFSHFLRRAAKRGYTRSELPQEWRQYVRDWYATTVVKWQTAYERSQRKAGHILRKRIRKGDIGLKDLLWKWYGHTKQQLPPEQQSETPKKHRRKRQDFVTRDKITKSQRIANLQAQIERTHDPNLKTWLKGLIERERSR